MSQKEPSEAANFKANAALCASGEIWVLNEVQREVVRHHVALALDAFAAQAVAAHAREPDEERIREITAERDAALGSSCVRKPDKHAMLNTAPG